MSTLLHYPQQACSLDSIIAASQCATDEQADFEKRIKQANTAHKANLSSIIIPDRQAMPKSVFNQLSHKQHQTLRNLTQQYGGAAVMSLAQMFDHHQVNHYLSNINTFGSNGMGAAVASTGQVLQKVHHYQVALEEFENYRNHNAAPATQQRLKLKTENAFKEMSRTLRHRNMSLLEKNRFKQKQVKNMSGRIVNKSIPISQLDDVQKLSRFAKTARVLGPGLIALDGGLRYNKVRLMKKNNDPLWKREAIVQSASFAAGVAAGVIIGAFVAPIAGSLLLVLVIGGAAGLATDAAFQRATGKAYDFLAN